MAIQFHKLHAGSRSYTCDSCHFRYWASAKELAIDLYKVYSEASDDEIVDAIVCEGCLQDGVLDDININGDIGTVNTREAY